jgi:hypothetical protein
MQYYGSAQHNTSRASSQKKNMQKVAVELGKAIRLGAQSLAKISSRVQLK